MSRTLFPVALVAAVVTVAAFLLSEDRPDAGASYGQVPLSFEDNRGQFEETVRFAARGQGYTLFLTPQEAVLSLQEAGSNDRRIVRSTLSGARADPAITAEMPQAGRSHYLIGRDRSGWIRDVQHFGRVRYDDAYPGIDVVYYGNQGRLEYDFELAPHADPGVIRVQYTGVDGAEIGDDGELRLRVGDNAVVLEKPVVYQLAEGRREVVEAHYAFNSTGQGVDVAFGLGAYDPTRALVIDPVLVYSTFLGGDDKVGASFTSVDSLTGIAVDSSGSAYVTGFSASANFPTTAGAHRTTRSAEQYYAVVAKLAPNGQSLVYSTFLGGSNGTRGRGIAVNGTGEAHIVGTTSSPDFPVEAELFDYTDDGDAETFLSDAFVTKLDASGSDLAFSTFLGGSNGDAGNDIALDPAGRIYVTGTTRNTDDEPTRFPTTAGAFQAGPGAPATGDFTANDGFVAKIDLALNGTQRLVYSSFLGGGSTSSSGAGDDVPTGIVADAAGKAFVVGSTRANDFPTTSGVVQSTKGDTSGSSSDAFVTAVAANGQSLAFSTYLGGSGTDVANAVAIDGTGRVYVLGLTQQSGATFPTTANALDSTAGGINDAFITVLAADGKSQVYSSFLGGAGSEGTTGTPAGRIVVDADGRFHACGTTNSADFPTTIDAVQSARSGTTNDAFVSSFAALGAGTTTTLQFGSYLGGSNTDACNSLAADGDGNLYLAGNTQSGNSAATPFPRVTPVQSGSYSGDNFGGISGGVPGTTVGSTDGFVAKIGEPPVAGGPGEITLSGASFTVTEGNGGTVFARRTGGSVGAVSVTYATSNGTATAGDFAASTNTITWADGDVANKTITFATIEDTESEANETFALTLSAPMGGATLGSPSSATITIADDDSVQPVVLTLDAAAYTVDEAAGTATITVKRTGGTTGEVSVVYGTGNGTATATTDYTTTAGTLSWADGDATDKTFTIPVVEDEEFEDDETINVTLSAPTGGATLGTPKAAIVTITDNDVAVPGTLQLGAATYTVNEQAGFIVVTVQRVGGSDGAGTVSYATFDGNALAPVDYLATSGTLTWADGDATEKSFTISIVNDADYEDGIDETFTVVLTTPSSTVPLGTPSTAMVTIVDDDPPQRGMLQFSAPTYAGVENTGVVNVVVTRVGGADGPVSVNFATRAGTAAAGIDYNARTGTLDWADQDAAPRTIALQLIDDGAVESVETFTVGLTQPGGGAILGAPAEVTVSVDDNDVSDAGRVKFDVSSIDVVETAGVVVISVVRTGSSAGDVSVAYSTINGEAAAGSDYATRSGRLNWPDGDMDARLIEVPVMADIATEGNENFTVLLSSPAGGLELALPTSIDVVILDASASSSGGDGEDVGGALGWPLLVLLAGAGWVRRRWTSMR